MNVRSAAYWTTTIVTALVLLSGGVLYLVGAEGPRFGMAALGYPAHFMLLLSVWKVLGGLAILAPRLPLLKEWAYAGIAFDLTGASVSHFAVGDPVANVIAPLVFLAIAAASWALRPGSRVLPGVNAPGPAPARDQTTSRPASRARTAVSSAAAAKGASVRT
jgi:hypothetical protein